MEFTIAFVATIVVLGLISIGKSRRRKRPPVETDEQRRQREAADEVVTVVLPTINHDK